MSRPCADAGHAVWRTWIRQRGWLLGSLLLILGALAGVEYHWIDEVIEAQQQRTVAGFSEALISVKTEFDFEITRAFVVFGQPTAHDEEYSMRYAEWLRWAPYPRLLLGVYRIDISARSPRFEPIATLGPMPAPAAWQSDTTRLVPFLESTAVLFAMPCSEARPRALGPLPQSRWQLSTRESSRDFELGARFEPAAGPVIVLTGHPGLASPLLWDLTIAGNPAFAFAMTPRTMQRSAGNTLIADKPEPDCGFVAEGRPATEASAPKSWVIAVFDVNYMTAVLLPELLRRHLEVGSPVDHGIRIIDNRSDAPNRVIFSDATSARAADLPDRHIDLFEPRLNCFALSHYRVPASGNAGVGQESDTVSRVELLTRRSSSCDITRVPRPRGGGGLWTLQLHYQPASIEHSLAAFRRRSVLFSCGALLVLGLGVLTLVLVSERARSLAEIQTELLLGVSHELRTPMTVIRIAADNLRKGMVASATQAREYGDAIGAQAARLSDMIEDTLMFARLRSDQQALATQPTRVAELISNSLAHFETTLSDAGVEVRTEIEPELPLLDVNTQLIGKCLGNLIENVLKYAASGGWLAIRASHLGPPEHPRVRISIEDRGPGIDAGDLPHVFQPFYRGKRARGAPVAGLGLGLTFVKRVVEAHRGTIEVRTDGTGTVFTLILP